VLERYEGGRDGGKEGRRGEGRRTTLLCYMLHSGEKYSQWLKKKK
jgi:hypothetical protein